METTKLDRTTSDYEDVLALELITKLAHRYELSETCESYLRPVMVQSVADIQAELVALMVRKLSRRSSA